MMFRYWNRRITGDSSANSRYVFIKTAKTDLSPPFSDFPEKSARIRWISKRLWNTRRKAEVKMKKFTAIRQN